MRHRQGVSYTSPNFLRLFDLQKQRSSEYEINEHGTTSVY